MITKTKKKLMRRFQLFDLWLEEWDGHGSLLDMEVYRTKRGSFISCRHRGRRPWIVRHIAKEGIDAIKASSKHCVCSIGRGADGKWWGWSHRAIVGFEKGDRIFQERFGDDHTPFKKHGRKVIKTDADAKLAAKRFAASVS